MTKIGRQLVNEFVNETLEKIEDDKSRIFIAQGASTLKRIITYTLVLLFQSIFTSVLFFLLAFVLFVDVEQIESVRTASNQEILEGIKAGVSAVMLFAMILGFLVPVVTVLMGRSIFDNKMGQRKEADQQEANLLSRIVEIQEELLIRHNLIKMERDYE